MALTIGTQLGSHEIIGLLGKGGMGEVYRARDLKLKREVAIKILPGGLAQDSDRLSRFQREAEVLASLNHPNIAAIHDLEETNGTRYLVLELVEGETLADRIARGSIPVEEALAIAKQLCEALEAAHERGIIHRDLKPANIKLTPDGKVKVLDFGLAKAMETQAAPNANLSNSPTIMSGASMPGLILGTAPYMSPEQAKGRPIDKRTDIFAFGCVLYEMLTAKPTFEGDDVSQIIAHVLARDPDWERLPATIPSRIRELLRLCLEKNVKNRRSDATDVRLDIELALKEPVTEAAPLQGLPRTRERLWISLAVVLLIGIAALSAVHFREKPPAVPVLRYSIAAPENSAVHSFAISPDGRYVVIAANINGKQQLWLRALDALQAQAMPFTEGATYPFWSPDSRYIGFFAQGRLKKVAAIGGPSQSLCDVPNNSRGGFGGSWGRDDVIIFSPTNTPISIQKVSAAGGTPSDVNKTKGDQRHPVFLPDGRRFLYLVREVTPEKSGIYVGSLDGTENRRILPDVSGAVFAPAPNLGRAGDILFVRENTLMALPFNAGNAQPAGEVFPVADGVGLNNGTYLPATVSDNGVLLYLNGGVGGNITQMAFYDRNGKLLSTVGTLGAGSRPAISPDEKSVAFQRLNDASSDLWVRDLVRGTETRLTNGASTNATPFWSPKGDRIAFTSRNGGIFNLFVKAATGNAQDEPLLTNDNVKIPSQWSRDGRFIVYFEVAKTKTHIWVLPMEGSGKDRKPVPFLQTEFNELMGQLSPDSHWMAFTSDQSGRREVYVRPFPPADGQWTISVAGGQEPRWRGDGKELFFEAADGKMMAVPVKASGGPKPAFEAGTPVALFDAQMTHIANNTTFEYDVTADGKRFLINTDGKVSSSPPLTVVVNWNAESKK